MVQNFYKTFGTSGCLLSCNKRRDHQEQITRQARLGSSNAMRYRKKKEMIKSLKNDIDHAFTLAELEESIESGCKSCKVLKSIFEQVALIDSGEDKYDASTTFNVSVTFLLKKRRMVGGQVEVQQIGLFVPTGRRYRTRAHQSLMIDYRMFCTISRHARIVIPMWRYRLELISGPGNRVAGRLYPKSPELSTQHFRTLTLSSYRCYQHPSKRLGWGKAHKCII